MTRKTEFARASGAGTGPSGTVVFSRSSHRSEAIVSSLTDCFSVPPPEADFRRMLANSRPSRKANLAQRFLANLVFRPLHFSAVTDNNGHAAQRRAFPIFLEPSC
jgi:hypothetical protein